MKKEDIKKIVKEEVERTLGASVPADPFKEKLVKILKNHHVNAWIGEGGELLAVEESTINGEPRSETVQLHPTIEAVRDFLGY